MRHIRTLNCVGTRSRTGKLLRPKFGILGFLLDSVLSGRVKDAIICPVSTQYDKVLETPYAIRSKKTILPAKLCTIADT